MTVTQAELVTKWVEKLRKPGAKQAVGVLRSSSGARCALGHLCDAAKDLGMGDWTQTGQASWVFESEGQRGEVNYPPSPVMSLFEDKGVPLTYEGRTRWVYSLNDSVRLPLNTIADLLEAEYL